MLGITIYGGAGEALYFHTQCPSGKNKLSQIQCLLMENRIHFSMSIKKKIYRIYINQENLNKISTELRDRIHEIYHHTIPRMERKKAEKDMRYFSEPKAEWEEYITYGKTIRANHPIYDYCTVYQINGKGLAVIQQRFDPETKCTHWGPIDEWLTSQIYLNPKFLEYFNQKAALPKYVGFFSEEKIKKKGMGSVELDFCDQRLIYPTVTVRQIMWALRMKPLKKEPWETVFDRNPI